MSTFFLLTGTLLLLLIMYDFFFTTLSSSGAGFFTKWVSIFTHKIINALVRIMGRKVYNISGMLINLTTLANWVFWVWLGLFFIFSFDPGGIVNSDGRMATAVERLYFTGYTLSTLGIGNFYPTTPFFEILTSIFILFRFCFFYHLNDLFDFCFFSSNQ